MLPKIALPPQLFERGVAREAQAQSRETQELVVEWRVQRFTRDPNILHYSGGIKAKFGVTVLTADELVLNMSQKIGVATGNVLLTDPEGQVEAEQVVFDWENQTGSATNARIRIANIQFKTDRIAGVDGTWVIEAIKVTSGFGKGEQLAFGAGTVTVEPGKSAVAKKLFLELFGERVATFPEYTFNLDRRVQGLQPPTPSFKRGAGIGLTWDSGITVGESTAISATSAVFHRELPRYELALTGTAVRANRSQSRLLPRSDLIERFAESSLESIVVRSPEHEDRYFSDLRRTASISTTWNQTTLGRLSDARGVSKQWDLGAEVGGTAQNWGVLGQFRAQSIRPNGASPFRTRLVSQITAHSGPISFAEGLDVRVRLDGFGIQGTTGSGYGFARASAGLYARILPSVLISTGVSALKEFGTAQFLFDRPAVRKSWNSRLDLKVGPWTFGTLIKYDMDVHRWYDTEFTIALASGMFEPYIHSRLFPREFKIGVRIRALGSLGNLQNREPNRPAESGPESSISDWLSSRLP